MSSRFDQSEIYMTLRETVHNWAHEVLAKDAGARDETGAFDHALFQRLTTELGVTGSTLPADLGGAGLDEAAPVIIIEALAEADPAFAMSYLSQ